MRVTSLKNVSGFSLIELLAVIAIVAVVIGLAVPGFTTLIRGNRAGVQASSVINSINFARAEAVKRAVTVRITPLVAGSWQGGWRVWIDDSGDGSYADGADTELQVYPAFSGEATLTSAATVLAFDKFGGAYDVALGKVVNPGTTIDLSFRIGDGYCKLERDITINHLGRPTMNHRTDCE